MRNSINNDEEEEINLLVKEMEQNKNTEIDFDDFDDDEPMVISEYLYNDFFAGTYYSLMKKYKNKYSLSREDQADYLFESLFVLSI